MDERGPGGPRYSQPALHSFNYDLTGHGTSDFRNGLCLSIRFRKFVVFNASSHADTEALSIFLDSLWQDSSHPSDEDLSPGTAGSRTPSHVYVKSEFFRKL